MTDRITEILEDGTVYCFDMDKCIQEANSSIEKLYEKEGVELDYDFTATVFSLFIQCVYILTDSGWTTEELIDEVVRHSEEIDEDE